MVSWKCEVVLPRVRYPIFGRAAVYLALGLDSITVAAFLHLAKCILGVRKREFQKTSSVGRRP